jgi:hypothetical protein
MTNAHLVEYGSIDQFQKRDNSQKFVATVEAFRQECDLAVLGVDNPDFWNNKNNQQNGSEE